MELDEIIITSENVAVAVESPELYDTVSIRVVESEAIGDEEVTSIKLLYGSWVESGREDKQLEELYRSRLVPSVTLNE